MGWDHRVNLVLDEMAQNWFGIGELANWICCVSHQGEHLQGHKSFSSSGLLTCRPKEEQLYLGLRKLFQHR